MDERYLNGTREEGIPIPLSLWHHKCCFEAKAPHAKEQLQRLKN